MKRASTNQTLRLRPAGLDWVRTGDEVVALDGSRGLYLGTNQTGAELWEALAAGTSREALIEQQVAAYGIDLARATADIDAFLQQLREQDLLVEE